MLGSRAFTLQNRGGFTYLRALTACGRIEAMPAKPYERIILKNGLRVILVPQKGSLATTVAVLVSAGSKYETKELNGISHFLEHMCFKGTVNRPSMLAIASEFDSLGAENNAFTSEEMTSYYAKAKNNVAPKLVEILADMYVNPLFNTEDIEKERGVIIEEINMYEDLPQRRVQELIMELVYGDQPAGWAIAGTKENVRRFTRDDFVAYRARHYVPKSTVVLVSGGFNRSILKDLERHFLPLAAGKKDTKLKVIEKQATPAELLRHKESDQTHIVVGFRAFDEFDERRFALQVLADILGGGIGSRLFQLIRAKLGAAYYVHANADLYSDHGLFAMSAGLDHKKVEIVLEALLGECARFTKDLVPKDELARAKEHMTGGLLLSLETSDQLGYFYAGQEIAGQRIMDPQTLERKVRAVTAENIRKVARDIFKDRGLNLALIGPAKDKSFKKLLKVK